LIDIERFLDLHKDLLSNSRVSSCLRKNERSWWNIFSKVKEGAETILNSSLFLTFLSHFGCVNCGGGVGGQRPDHLFKRLLLKGVQADEGTTNVTTVTGHSGHYWSLFFHKVIRILQNLTSLLRADLRKGFQF